jgi:uncharacterized protein (DUF362 family)/NAD-dependent dihydropyrimidine dehydrogenase PreA subunit
MYEKHHASILTTTSCNLTGVTSEKKTVSLAGCSDYSRKRVTAAVAKAVELIGGIESFASPGQKILVKPNLLHVSKIDEGVTTHPEVVYAVAKLFIDHGCKVVIGDSPGAGASYKVKGLKRSYEAAGLDKVALELGAELNFDTGYRSVPNPRGKMIKRFNVINPAMDADAIVSVSKMKTHLLTYITGGTKNLFGILPGMEKPTFHGRLPDAYDFGMMLVDLNVLMKPRLQVMDAVMAMEGNGPTNGKMRKVGAVLASNDFTAIDVAASRIMSVDPVRVCTIRAAIERGLIDVDLSDISFEGEDIEQFVIKGFKKPQTYLKANQKQGRGWQLLGNMAKAYALRPSVIKENCIGCDECRRICSRRAITIRNNKAQIDLKKCIRCYSCHETCVNKAIKLEKSLGGKLITKMSG